MKMGVAHFLAALLFLMVCADSARDFLMPIADDGERNYPFEDDTLILRELAKLFENEVPSSEGFLTDFCHSCLEFSRKAKRILNDPTLFAEIDSLSSIFCHIVPSSLESQCINMVEKHKYEAVMFLQDAVVEDKLCNSTGICPGNAQESSSSTSGKAELHSAMEHFDEMLSKVPKGSLMEEVSRLLSNRNSLTDDEIPMELRSNGTCNACRSVLDKIRGELEDPDKQLKLITSLLKACEAEVFVYRCKKLVFSYGPIVITNIQKIVSMDLCRMLHICKDPRNQTDHMNLMSIESSRRYLPNTIAQVDLM